MSRQRATDNACGTLPGWSRHRRRGEDICEPCRLARNAYQNDANRRKSYARWAKAPKQVSL